MYAFFSEQADSLFFASSVILIALSVVCLTLGRRRLKLGWFWLAAFGVLLSLSRLLTLVGHVAEGQPHFVTLGVVTQILAFVALLQFACAGHAASRGLFVVGIVVPQVAAVVVGVLQRFPGPDAVSLGALELVAGLWAGVRIYESAAGEWPATRLRLRLAGLLFAACGLLWGVPTLINGTLYYALQPVDPLQVWTHGAEPVLAGAFLLFLTLALDEESPGSSSRKRSALRHRLMLWCLPTLGVFLLGSLKLIDLTGEFGNRSQRDVLLTRARTAVAAVNTAWLRDLGGAPEDAFKPSYSNLCAQLRLIRATDPDTRFVYLMCKRAGQVAFMAESETADSPDHSPPGQIYDEASPELKQMFETGRAFVEGPVRDRWGYWESAFAPVWAGGSQTPVFVLGMDVDARLGRRIVAQHRLAGIGLSLVLNLLVLALFTGLHVSLKSARAAAASESRFRTMFENAPEAVCVFEVESGRILASNPFMAAWLGFTQEALYGMTVQDLVAGTLEQIRARILHGRDTDPAAAGDFVFRRKDGVCMPAETTGDALRFQEIDSIVLFARDVTERRLAESELRKRGALLNGLAEAARILLTGEDYTAAIDRALAAMGRAAGVDAAYVFENHTAPQSDEPVATRRFVWRDKDLSGGQTVFSDLQSVSYTRFRRWLYEFSAGRTISGPVQGLPVDEREMLACYGVRSLVTVPIMIDGRLWGFIGFDDCKTERQWSEAEISIVSAAASSIGGAIKRRDAEERLQKSLSELERFNRLMVGRETRVVELKREINDLLRELGRPPAYASVEKSPMPPQNGTAGT